MARVAIIICARYRDCGGGKCFRALRERHGTFSRYAAGEPVELVGYSTCGGCPGRNVERVSGEFLRNGCDVVHLATGLVVGYPPCPNIRRFKEYIESRLGLGVVVGTHPIPLKYLRAQERLSFWGASGMHELAAHLLAEPHELMEAYN